MTVSILNLHSRGSPSSFLHAPSLSWELSRQFVWGTWHTMSLNLLPLVRGWEREDLLLYVLREALWVPDTEGTVEEPDSENYCDTSRVSMAGCWQDPMATLRKYMAMTHLYCVLQDPGAARHRGPGCAQAEVVATHRPLWPHQPLQCPGWGQIP